MEKDNGKWEELIRSKIYDYEADTIPDDWENLSARLDGRKTVRLYPYRKSIYAVAAAAAAIALFIIGGLKFFSANKSDSDTQVLVENTLSPIVDNNINAIENETIQVEPTVDNPVEKPDTKLLAVVVKQEKKVDKTALNTVEETPVELNPPLVDESDTEQKQEKTPDIQVVESVVSQEFMEEKKEDVNVAHSHLATITPEIKRRRWGFGVGGGGYAVSSTSGALPVATSSGVLHNDEYMRNGNNYSLRRGNPNASLFDPFDGLDNSITNNVMGKITHKTPLSGGLGVSYYLSDRWTLSSGLVYTLLRSKGSYLDNAGNTASWKQNLHFIGIPLSASYSIAEWKNIHFYVSAGGMGELNVAGRQKKTVSVDNLESLVMENIRMKEPLWSVNSRAGAVYPLWKFINVYAEAGVSYYFDNKSTIETIRSEKPFNISLQAGIRLGF